MLTQVLINSLDVTSYLVNYEYERTYGDCISQVEINVVKTISTLLTLQTGLTVTIYRGWVTATEQKIFDGYIESFEADGGKIQIIGKDKMWNLVRKEITHVYDINIDASAGKISEIFKDIVTTYGGLTADGTSIQDSGTSVTIDKFVCNHSDLMDRCKALAKILDWVFYYRADTDKVYFEPRGFTTNTNLLEVGSNIIQVPKWTYDNTEMVNDLTVVGAYSEIETTESGKIGTTIGYATSGIQLNFEPISVKVYGDMSNPPTTLLIGGVPGSTISYDYYVDDNQKKILPFVGGSFVTNSYFEIRYSHAVPIPVHMYNQASIDQYGQFKKTITYNDLKGVSDAEIRGAQYLVKYAIPFIYSEIKVKNVSTYGLKEGQIIRTIDNVSTPNVDKYLVISRYRIRYPSDYDELLVGDKAWRLAEWQSSIEEKLKRILEEEMANQDLIVEIVNLDNYSYNPINVNPRYFQVLTDDGITGEELYTLLHYDDYYDEVFIDTDFKDEGFTTADWDVTNHWLKFY